MEDGCHLTKSDSKISCTDWNWCKIWGKKNVVRLMNTREVWNGSIWFVDSTSKSPSLKLSLIASLISKVSVHCGCIYTACCYVPGHMFERGTEGIYIKPEKRHSYVVSLDCDNSPTSLGPP